MSWMPCETIHENTPKGVNIPGKRANKGKYQSCSGRFGSVPKLWEMTRSTSSKGSLWSSWGGPCPTHISGKLFRLSNLHYHWSDQPYALALSHVHTLWSKESLLNLDFDLFIFTSIWISSDVHPLGDATDFCKLTCLPWSRAPWMDPMSLLEYKRKYGKIH